MSSNQYVDGREEVKFDQMTEKPQYNGSELQHEDTEFEVDIPSKDKEHTFGHH
jgi:hypothetical protein